MSYKESATNGESARQCAMAAEGTWQPEGSSIRYHAKVPEPQAPSDTSDAQKRRPHRFERPHGFEAELRAAQHALRENQLQARCMARKLGHVTLELTARQEQVTKLERRIKTRAKIQDWHVRVNTMHY